MRTREERERLAGEAISLFRQKVEHDLGCPVETILFGSYARGEATRDSDIDVMVILPQLNHAVLDTLFEIAWEVGFNAGVVLSIIPIARDEVPILEHSPFFQAVRQEGVTIE